MIVLPFSEAGTAMMCSIDSHSYATSYAENLHNCLHQLPLHRIPLYALRELRHLLCPNVHRPVQTPAPGFVRIQDVLKERIGGPAALVVAIDELAGDDVAVGVRATVGE